MMLDHDHHAHSNHDPDHAPVGAHDDHEVVFARDIAKDQVRVSAASLAWITPGAFAPWLVAAVRRPPLVERRTLRQRRETDPPLAQAWQFVQRCAPASAAPPALG